MPLSYFISGYSYDYQMGLNLFRMNMNLIPKSYTFPTRISLIIEEDRINMKVVEKLQNHERGWNKLGGRNKI
jgi:hypothetical protein